MEHIIYRDRSSWHYVDLEDYEYQIVQSMTSAAIERRRNLRKRKAAERRQKHNRRIYFAIQRLIGLLLVVGNIFTIYTLKGTDITYAIVIVPIGLLMMFSKEMCLAIGRKKKCNRS